MQENYEDIVRKWYVELQPKFRAMISKNCPTLRMCEADDLYQDTFIAVQENLLAGRIKEDTSWSSYILTIGLNLARKQYRHDKITDTADETDTEGDGAKVARDVQAYVESLADEEGAFVEDPEAQAKLGDELTRTPEPCGSIVRLFYYSGLSMDEIAEEVGYRNAQTAKAKKSQCMKDLVRRVKESFHRAGII